MAEEDSEEGAAFSALATFKELVEASDRKFARVRDLPPYARGPHTALYYQKVFKAYTRLWKFQQEHRQELLASGLQRWEIGEIASRIGQLYYGQYLRTSEARYLLEAYVFYGAILNRGYFEAARRSPVARPDLRLRCKELRFHARFLIVALLLNKNDVVRQLADRLRALVDESTAAFSRTKFKEWKQVLQEIARFLKADTTFSNTRALRYNELFDVHPFSLPYIARFHANRKLRLQDALLTSYHQNEVKFTELTLDTFRMLQCLEWEPSVPPSKEPSENGALCDQSGASGIIDINLAADMTDPFLPPNPRKAVIYHPSVAHFVAVTATICEELSPDSILLIYLSASGKGECSNASVGSFLCLGSRGTRGLDNLYPEDLIPFTRRPLFLIIDSDNSHAFKVIHDTERGEPSALLLSHERPALVSETDPTSGGSQFTYFLTAPLQAFCQLVGLSPDIEAEAYHNAESLLSFALAEWEVVLFTSKYLNQVWAQVLSDPLLRRLILRFIFCRAVLALLRSSWNSTQHLPECLPCLPESLSPDCAAIQSFIVKFAKTLGVLNYFRF